MYLDTRNYEANWRDIYKLATTFIQPRPIAFASTISAAGVRNLAPFSFYNMVSANPPVVVFCPGFRRDGSAKHTLVNVRATRQFVIATVSQQIVTPMAACAADLPYGDSEFDFSGLTPTPATKVDPPLVKESPANIECKLRQIVTINEAPGAGSVVFGDILAVHVADDLLDANDVVDPHKLRTVGRLGKRWYCTVTDPYEVEIPPAP